MCSHHKKYYLFGKTGVMIDSPRFTEKSTLSIFACNELESPDTCVEVRVNDNITVPEYSGVKDGDSEIFYNASECVTVVRSGENNRVLWKTRTSGKNIFAEISPDREATLNTYEILRICDLPRAFINNGSVILHASFVESNGKAILFSGDKQIGKSTQARLWQQYGGAQIVNGDRALLEKKNGTWYASGLPFCGTSGICENKSFPIQAVVLLSKGTANTVNTTDKMEAFFAFMRQCSYDRMSREQSGLFFDIAEDFVDSVTFVNFECLPDSSAVSTLQQVLMEL